MQEKHKNISLRIKNIENKNQAITIDDDEPNIQKQIKQNEYQFDGEITPWLSQNTASIKHPTIRFHNEIIDFYDYIIPTSEEHRRREQAIMRVETFIKEFASEVDIQAFGSFKTKLYLPNADIDVVMIDKSMSAKELYKKVAQSLMKSDKFENVNLIANAKVPIIKFFEVESQYQFDISFNQMDGLKQIDEIRKAFTIYPEFKYLIMILKCMLKQRELNETYSGGIGSFLLFQMILAFLREIRKEAFANKKQEQLKNITLGEYILRFLEFYGQKFDYQRKRILMINGGSITNKPTPDDKFSLISPQDPDHDIGSGSFKIKEIFKIFANRFNFMSNYNFKPEESVLKYLINPSDQKFTFIKQI
ncbi:unnamed protein product (macronuclear) [Paramecium tetraurelia]|uniref:Poly(A) RNA polymerase mitochondrial-like central palm domain-containing protein n=1 Tax=Paramecium tetraurelia TaxID=5888 RepID=A0DPQ3_PARTE|nr:uncharacterized protein GSPATT00019202001 [Paramecium tetraurelia]CAK85020.1 unnamed protein product [Paramecium tetraurelia]|eukprot:XP_001452417.1 hypothetical protein (macronuclear) [Paramecium tetraurelia strain d4-2]